MYVPGWVRRRLKPTLRPAEFTPDGFHDLSWRERQPRYRSRVLMRLENH
jgi:hypothetical protein